MTEELRKKIFKIIVDNAEDPDELDTVDMTGTFTTFRAEYLVNDIESLIKQAQYEYGLELINEMDKSPRDYSHFMEFINELRQRNEERRGK